MTNAMTPFSHDSRVFSPPAACLRSPPLRIALYSHDTVGLGHTRRNLQIAGVLSAAFPNASILMLTGTVVSGQFRAPPRVDFMTLPALTKGDGGLYEARTLELSLKQLIKLRSRAIRAALKSFKPDVFIVDNVPTGAAGELTRVLEKLRKKGRTRCVLGLRDILDEPEAVKRQWAKADNEAAIERYFDEVWVYGDDRVCDQAEVYSFKPATVAKMRYLGYFDSRERLAATPIEDALPEGVQPNLGKLVLGQVGGGEDGALLARAFAETQFPEGYYGVLVTGPYLPAALRDELSERAARNPRLQVLELVTEPVQLLQHAARVIAMGGYNTTFEALSFAKPLLVVPRVTPRLEQYVRAGELSRLGLLDYLHPDELSVAALEGWLQREVKAPKARAQLNFNATARLQEALLNVLERSLLPPLNAPGEARHAAA